MSTATTARMNPLNGCVHKPLRFGFVVPPFADGWDIKVLNNGWGVCVHDISPDTAKQMLETNVSNQRKIIRNSVMKFAADMSNDSWRLTHQGIAFNIHGQLHDGQNRLTAVIESGKTLPMLVFFGAGGNSEMVVIDSGKNRTATDAATVCGVTANTATIGIVNSLIRQNLNKKDGWGKASPTKSEILQLHMKYENELNMVESWFHCCKSRGVNRAPIKAAILSAMLCGYDPAMLERFTNVVCDKIPATMDVDSAPRMLRQHVANNRLMGGEAYANDIYLQRCGISAGK